MLRSRSMVSCADTTGIPLGWGMAPRFMGAGRFIPNMSRAGDMPPCKGEAAMLDSMIRACQLEGTCRIIPTQYDPLLMHRAPDRGHTKSFFSLMLGLVIIGMAGQTYDSRIYTVCAPWNGRRGDAYVRVFRPAFLTGLMGITDDYDSLYSHA